ncbi:MAG: type II CRISPR RNA-guided endonuclease Cas9 [bacterium]
MHYRLGIDLGTNSLGWAVLQLDQHNAPRQLIDLGVRIFSDARHPKDKSSNAAQRRGPRGQRRNKDRQLLRKGQLMTALMETGLMPAEEQERKKLEALDPWILRSRALDEKLTPYETGRALFHLNQRRGFKSNRKADGEGTGKIHDAIEITREKLYFDDARTLGELFGRPRRKQADTNRSAAKGQGAPMPLARVRSHGIGAKLAYDYYPLRAMILDEFDQIWQAQAAHHGAIFTESARAKIRDIIEFQRPLKPQKAGKCTFLPDQPRAPKALPSVQYYRILKEVNNLMVGPTGQASRPLTLQERETLIDFLAKPSSQRANRSFDQIRKKLDLPESQRFNLESEKRKELIGDLSAGKLKHKDRWGPEWLDLLLKEQDTIVSRLLEEENEDTLISWLMQEFGFEESRAINISRLNLPEGHGKLSLAAIARLLPHMRDGKRDDEAADIEFQDHRALGDGEVFDQGLPYYGQILSRHTAFEKDNPKNDEEKYGRVANPTVHVALNQLQKVINDLIRRYGPPEQIVLELARDLPLSDKGLRELESLQKKNQEANDQRRAELAKLNRADTYDNRLKLRLYEEYEQSIGLPVCCIFTGTSISKTELLSDNIEIEHILPLSASLDDGIGNKVLATRQANRDKKNRSPFDAFGHSPDGYDWDKIAQRADALPAHKRWRFAPNAMEKFQEQGAFLKRHLNDTRYIARLGKKFTEALYGGQGAKGQSRQVWVTPGRLTSDLRHYAGFNGLLGDDNKKDRADHRHHAIDAVVIALTDQATVKRAADLAKRDDDTEFYDLMKEMAAPLKRYRHSIRDRLDKMTVSHKPDHGYQDAMHNDTAYGVTGMRSKDGQALLVTRKGLDSFDKPKQLEKIRDEILRDKLKTATASLKSKAFTQALVEAGKAMTPPVHSVRILDKFKDSSFITIHHGTDHSKAYMGDGNYCYDIWADEKGKWTGEVISTFRAYQYGRKDPDWWQKMAHPDNGQALIMRLRKNDMLELEHEGRRLRVTIAQITPGKVLMAEHFEANVAARTRGNYNGDNPLKYIIKAPSALQKANAILLTVSPSGSIKRKKPK